MAEKPYKAIMVSQTHWDRAWYVPFESFRMRLVRLIDCVIDILDRDPNYKSFMLDGQMLPVEDYLEIRPERRGDLERLVRAGRLEVGPWYALADEYLVSPEALIRNLLIGTQMAAELGDVMREGYVPDAFGHINQLPQILAGFDIGSAVFWRGLGDEGEQLGNEFWWQAPDGTRLLTVHLPDGYHNASNLGYPMRWGDPSAMEFDMELALDKLRSALDLLKPRSRTRQLLLMNGIDHADPDPLVPEVIERANAVMDDVEIEHGALREYVSRVRGAAESVELPVFQGEFNRGRYAVILQGVYSTRNYIKQANERVQTLLERYAEPLAAWAWTLGEDYPAAFLRHAWKRLLQNHPHDDICGCSIDEVHRENMVRFHDAEQVGSIIARDSLRTLAGHVDRAAQGGVPFVVYNPLGWAYTGTAELSLLFDREDARANGFRLMDAAGRRIPYQVLGRGEHFSMEVLKANRKHEVRAAVRFDALPACGYRVLYALPGESEVELEAPVEATTGDGGQAACVMENRFLRVEVNGDGSFNLLDKETGRRFSNLGYLADDEDAGDEYDYSPAPEGQTVNSLGGHARVRLIHGGPLQATAEVNLSLQLPESLEPDRRRRSQATVPVPVTTLVTLRHDSRSVELRTTVDNTARDHRLRVCFPAGVNARQSVAGGHFDVVERPVEIPQAEGWEQPPVPTRHQRGFVDVSGEGAGLAVFSRGLQEYEVLRDGQDTVAVTLLRCVDAISRGGLLSRPSHAGIPVLTPEAQCQGRHTFEYAVRPHEGNWETIYREAMVFQAPLYLRRGDETEGYLPNEVWVEHTPDALQGPANIKQLDLSGPLPGELSFLAIEPAAIALSAVKRSERGDALVVRCYNPTGRRVDATLRFYRPLRSAQLANLGEEVQSELSLTAPDTLSLPVGAKQACTVRVAF